MFDIVIEGLDVVVIYKMDSIYGIIMIIGLVNYNDIDFDLDFSEYLDLEDIFDFKNGIFEMCGVFFVIYSYDVWFVVVRLSYYGEYENVGSDDGDVINEDII